MPYEIFILPLNCFASGNRDQEFIVLYRMISLCEKGYFFHVFVGRFTPRTNYFGFLLSTGFFLKSTVGHHIQLFLGDICVFCCCLHVQIDIHCPSKEM